MESILCYSSTSCKVKRAPLFYEKNKSKSHNLFVLIPDSNGRLLDDGGSVSKVGRYGLSATPDADGVCTQELNICLQCKILSSLTVSVVSTNIKNNMSIEFSLRVCPALQEHEVIRKCGYDNKKGNCKLYINIEMKTNIEDDKHIL